ncbi:glycosyltransferase [Methylobacterium sp. NEAU 140]|uniref:glycosyltransferase family protein n=1 Tax=Methylobacterium sp. NEAU 140 TaxID=3064945 RepID=UPI002733AC3C|nr:glycosyltransferase [Methylobacterium sp. NEAU 140]MDP4021306.1 glycosyltransferase [Methylobacterium sp. NEAU 140]
MRADEAAGLRVLIYSHDTFGLGHLRRSRAIAHAVVAAHPGARVTIVSGSPVVDRYAFAAGVRTVRLPPVTKLPDGAYASGDPAVPLAETVARRAAAVARTAAAFRPHLFLVDKEPAGFHGELLPTLEAESARGTRLVLGLRDVLDDAELLVPEWARKGAAETMDRFYDEIWVYGLGRIHAPLAALPLAPDAAARLAARLIYTGYLRRDLPAARPGRREPGIAAGPFLLVTPGGGGDGAALIDWVIAAYEADPGIPLPCLIAFGPFLDEATRSGFDARIARRPEKIAAITFDSEIEFLMRKAAGVVAMGGYNTFCEILSFDRPAVLVPRTEPRREQAIRARAAERLGLARVLMEADGRAPERMAAALRALPDQPEPSRVVVPGLLDGLGVVAARVRALTAPVPRRAYS